MGMSEQNLYDPFEQMPFVGYIDESTGRQETYLSLAHFYHTERLRGTDEHYRRYLMRLEDPELFQLEVEGLGVSGSQSRVGWDDLHLKVIYAGIYMQAVSNRNAFTELVQNANRLEIVDSDLAHDIAAVMSQFISDLSGEPKLKVGFLGGTSSTEFASNCLGVIFAKNSPQCLFALEDDICTGLISRYAQSVGSAFSLISSSLTDEAIADNFQRRCNHLFKFHDPNESARMGRVSSLLDAAGAVVRPLQQPA
jgi:hypothetical protein